MSAQAEHLVRLPPVLSAREVRVFEARLFGGDEAREWAAMQAAGRAIATAVLRDFEGIGGFAKPSGDCQSEARARLLVLVGKGHNGGDALLAAEAILERYPAAQAEVVFVFGERGLRPLAWRAWVRLQTCFAARVRVLTPRDLAERVGTSAYYALCLDGVFGFQFRPPLEERAAAVLAAANRLDVGLRAAVDLPSGLGEGGAFRADFTYATGILKREALGLRNAGRLRYLDLGFFKNEETEPFATDRVLTAEVLAPLRAWRDPHADKRAQGQVFVLAGSREYPGAALMCVLAALRSGAGLVTAFVPESLVPSFAAQVPEAIWVGWPETPRGGLALEGAHLLREQLARAAGERSALVLGPGIGRERETQVLVGEVVAAHSGELPVLLDADGLQADVLGKARAPLVLTPHEGEFRRLSGVPASGEALREFARRSGARVVLKGPVTRICDGSAGASRANGGSDASSSPLPLPIYHSLFGGPVLARGGSGDLLAGMIGTQLAAARCRRNSGEASPLRDPLQASYLEAVFRAVVWHGLAAEALERAQGAQAVRTTDLLNYLGTALRE